MNEVENYVHLLDEELTENIKNMLKSNDRGNIKLALGIINHCDLNDKNTLNNIKDVIEDTECCLCFDVIQPLSLDSEPIYLTFSSAKL
jgi:hypothetical protein